METIGYIMGKRSGYRGTKAQEASDHPPKRNWWLDVTGEVLTLYDPKKCKFPWLCKRIPEGTSCLWPKSMIIDEWTSGWWLCTYPSEKMFCHLGVWHSQLTEKSSNCSKPPTRLLVKSHFLSAKASVMFFYMKASVVQSSTVSWRSSVHRRFSARCQ